LVMSMASWCRVAAVRCTPTLGTVPQHWLDLRGGAWLLVVRQHAGYGRGVAAVLRSSIARGVLRGGWSSVVWVVAFIPPPLVNAGHGHDGQFC